MMGAPTPSLIVPRWVCSLASWFGCYGTMRTGQSKCRIECCGETPSTQPSQHDPDAAHLERRMFARRAGTHAAK